MAGGTRGQIIDGRFELLESLGSGGMGTVWRARDLALQREVALKAVRPPDPLLAPEGSPASLLLRERVLREAQALARLNHRNVVTIHHIVDSGPHPWLVMELVRGGSLQERVDAGPVPPAEAAAIGRDVLAGLRAAHLAGIHHRDVKPGNVLLRENGSAVLTDFGIAALQDSTALTATGELIGSPEYMAPERIRGTADHPASDLWSLGMTLYIAVEGHSPLRRVTSLATLAAVLDDPVPAPRSAGPLTPVLDALLVRDPDARPTADRLDALLATAAGTSTPGGPAAAPTAVQPSLPVMHVSRPARVGVPAEPAPGGPTVTHPRGRRRVPVVGAAAAAVAVVALVVAGVLTLGQGGRDEPADRAKSTAPPSPGSSRGGAADTDGETENAGTEDAGAEDSDSAEQTDGGEQDGRSDAAAPSGDASDDDADPSPGSPDGAEQPPGAADPGDGPGDAWVAQLFSEPVAGGTAARDQRLAAVRAEVPQAQVLRSDEYPSLNPGYWVIYAPGPFTDGRDAVRFCAERGRTDPDDCVGRYLSRSSADRVYVCYPQSGGSGRCTRP